MNKNLLYCIPAGQYGKEGVLSLLAQHPEIRFVSLVGIDLAGNDTDERIPIEIFMKDYEDFFAGKAVQTDGFFCRVYEYRHTERCTRRHGRRQHRELVCRL